MYTIHSSPVSFLDLRSILQELFAKEIPVAFAIDWKQSSDGNLSDAIQEKVESWGRNLPRFSCTGNASFFDLSQQGR